MNAKQKKHRAKTRRREAELKRAHAKVTTPKVAKQRYVWGPEWGNYLTEQDLIDFVHFPVIARKLGFRAGVQVTNQTVNTLIKTDDEAARIAGQMWNKKNGIKVVDTMGFTSIVFSKDTPEDAKRMIMQNC